MKTLKAWLDEGRGRYTALASHLGVSVGRVSQMAKDGVPPKDMLAIRDFTKGEVSLEAMVSARTRTPGNDQGAADHAVACSTATGERRSGTDRRQGPRRSAERRDPSGRSSGKPSNRKD